MKLNERLSKFRVEQRYTYRAMAELLSIPLSLVYDFVNARVARIDPDIAINIDTFLKERGY